MPYALSHYTAVQPDFSTLNGPYDSGTYMQVVDINLRVYAPKDNAETEAETL